MKKDCNRCDTTKRCDGIKDPSGCPSFKVPNDKWKLAELALAHPTSLNEALSALPFKVNLDFYLPKM